MLVVEEIAEEQSSVSSSVSSKNFPEKKNQMAPPVPLQWHRRPVRTGFALDWRQELVHKGCLRPRKLSHELLERDKERGRGRLPPLVSQ